MTFCRMFAIVKKGRVQINVFANIEFAFDLSKLLKHWYFNKFFNITLTYGNNKEIEGHFANIC